MPQYFIRARNSGIHLIDKGADYAHPDNALKVGVQGAIAIAVDEIAAGKHNAAVEVSIERQDGTRVLCSIVSLSVSPLSIEEAQRTESDV